MPNSDPINELGQGRRRVRAHSTIGEAIAGVPPMTIPVVLLLVIAAIYFLQ
jgi:hypothetical protein